MKKVLLATMLFFYVGLLQANDITLATEDMSRHMKNGSFTTDSYQLYIKVTEDKITKILKKDEKLKDDLEDAAKKAIKKVKKSILSNYKSASTKVASLKAKGDNKNIDKIIIGFSNKSKKLVGKKFKKSVEKQLDKIYKKYQKKNKKYPKIGLDIVIGPDISRKKRADFSISEASDSEDMGIIDRRMRAPTMAKKDVIFPDTKKKIVVGKYNSSKKSIEEAIKLYTKLGDKLPKSKLASAQTLAKAYKDEGFDKAYFKIGFVKNNLVFRIKSTKMKISYHQDILLAKNARPAKSKKVKAKKISNKTTKISLNTYVMVRPNKIPKNLTPYFEGGRGEYSAKVNIEIPGELSKAQINRMKDEAQEVLQVISTEMEEKVRQTAEFLSKSTNTNKENEDRIKKVDDELHEMLSEKSINAKVQEKLEAVLNKEYKYKQLHGEFQVKCATKAVIASLKATLAGVRLVASQGADVTAYKSIASSAKALYGVVKEYRKSEEKQRKELDEAAQSLEENAKASSTTVKVEIDKLMQTSKATLLPAAFKDLKAKYDNGELKISYFVSKKIPGSNTLKKKVDEMQSKKLKSAAKAKLVRYEAGLGASYKKLNAAIEKLIKSKASVKKSSLGVAVELWPKYTELLNKSRKMKEDMKEYQEYLSKMQTKLESLDVDISNDPILMQLKNFTDAAKAMDTKTLVKEGKALGLKAKTALTDIKTIAGLVEKIATEISEL